MLALIDEEDVNAVYMRRYPDNLLGLKPNPPSVPAETPVYNPSGATSGMIPQPSSPPLNSLYPTGELKKILKIDEKHLTRSGKNFTSAWKVYSPPVYSY